MVEDFSVAIGRQHFCVPFGYLRRSEITTWARDRSRPTTVKVNMKTSGANLHRPIQFHKANVPLDGEPKVVKLVAPMTFYAHHLFMQILDGKNHVEGRYERFIRDLILDLLNGEETRWGMLNWPPIPGLNLPSPSQCEAANSAFIIRLRAFVDGFIRTGIDSSGIETPSSRRVRASVDESPIMTVSADETPVVIFDAIRESWHRNQPWPLLNSDGTKAVAVSQPRWENQAPELYARDMATYYFQELLESPFLSCIGKCVNPNCKRYFFRQRQRKTAVKRGSYCGNCKLIGGAERTRLSRERIKLEMLKVAAQAWQEWATRGRRTDRARWVANRVNKVFGKTRFIRPKWVNQNREAIESLTGREHTLMPQAGGYRETYPAIVEVRTK